MSNRTIARRLAAASPRKKAFSLSALALSLLVGVAFLVTAFTSPAAQRIDLSLNTAAAKCYNVVEITRTFNKAVGQAQQTPPDYTGLKRFGFTTPLTLTELRTLRATLEVRLGQLQVKAKSVTNDNCSDDPTATITDRDGKPKKLAVVDGHQPMTPVSGSQSNRDDRTLPVTVGTPSDNQRTDTWSELDKSYGDKDWYVRCANVNLSLTWDQEVPKFKATEGAHDNRFILAVNVDPKLTDDQIRERAASDGNPRTEKLKVVRTASVINTRALKQNRCDEFIDTRSMIRVSLGKVVFDDKGTFKELKTDEGIFVDCHNMWRLPKSQPVPTPTPSTPGVTPPVKTPPTKTTPPTKPPQKCVPPAHENNNGKCIVPKRAQDGAAHRGNVPEQVKGKNPPAGAKSEPRPKDPPKTYKPPAPPKPKPTKPRPTPPPPPPEAPKPDNPGTQAPCAPGIENC